MGWVGCGDGDGDGESAGDDDAESSSPSWKGSGREGEEPVDMQVFGYIYPFERSNIFDVWLQG